MAQWTHAGAIVVRFNGRPEFLLITTTGKSDEWTFPKGHIEQDESPENAAMREVREEAGIFTEVVMFIGTTSFTKKNEVVTAAYYLLRCAGHMESHENRSIRWCDYETALGTLSFEDAKAMLISVKQQNLLMRAYLKHSG